MLLHMDLDLESDGQYSEGATLRETRSSRAGLYLQPKHLAQSPWELGSQQQAKVVLIPLLGA